MSWLMDAHAYAQELLADIKAARQSRVARNDFAALNLALNRISGEWDNEKLTPILTQLIELGPLKLQASRPRNSVKMDGLRGMNALPGNLPEFIP